MRKAYASQESIDTTLTAAERAAPFAIAEVDPEPLPKRTREAILADDAGVVALVDIHPQRGITITLDEPDGEVAA
jgi:hypothetical protein